MRRPFGFLALALLVPFLPHASAQSVISARSGLVNFFEGVVFVDGQPLERRSGTFPRLREGSILVTQSGRAEVLLTPDTYLRLGENSSVRMMSSDIDDTQVELLSGSSILDSAQAPEGEFVKIVFKDATIRILKPGNYRMDAEPAQLRVFTGEAEVTRNGNPVKIVSSQLMPLDGAPVVRRFTQGSDGLLDIWSEERGSLIASNMVNSQAISDPLLDTGPAVPADLASYIGYMPMATMPSVGLSPYGYSYLYPSYSAFSPYPSLAVMAIPAFRPPTYLYLPHYGYGSSPVYTSRPGYPGGLGYVSVPRPVYVSRPATAPRVGVGVHAIGHR